MLGFGGHSVQEQHNAVVILVEDIRRHQGALTGADAGCGIDIDSHEFPSLRSPTATITPQRYESDEGRCHAPIKQILDDSRSDPSLFPPIACTVAS
jgi:hypothetical protein